MEDLFNEIIKISSDNKVELGQKMTEVLNKELTLGMSRYVCRHGTLSEGHEKITPAQRYYQAIREIYQLSNVILDRKAQSMEIQADLIDAEEHLALLKSNTTPPPKSVMLRAEAKVMSCKQKLMSQLVSIQDSMRMLDEFTKVYYELQHEVRAKYPEGIEQAEPDNWEQVLKYRMLRNKVGHRDPISHIPMDMEKKAELAAQYGNIEGAIWLGVEKEEDIRKYFNGSIDKYIEEKRNSKINGGDSWLKTIGLHSVQTHG